MKNLFTLILCFAFYLTQAQNFIDKHFTEYEDLDNSTVVHVSAKSFDLASFVLPTNDEDEKELSEFVGSINALDVIAVPDLAIASSEYQRGVNILERSFSELVNIKEKGDRVSFYIDERNDIVYEVVGIGHDDEELFVVSITGEMDLSMIGAILSKIDDDNFKPISKLNEFDASEFKIFPNPVNSSTELTIDIPTAFEGGKGTIYDLKGGAMEQFNITGSQYRTSTENFTPGTYVVSLEKDDISMKKQVVIVR